MNISEVNIKQLNDLEGFLGFKQTWAFKMFLYATAKIVAMFTGNQFGKTAGVAFSYVMRILGIHPIPKKNVVYYECKKRNEYLRMEKGEKRDKLGKAYLKKHFRKDYGREDFGTFGVTKLPKDMLCPRCGGKVIEHKRGCRVFRFCSHTLPGGQKKEKGRVVEGIEVKNTQYPAFKKWCPKFLIKEDTTFRDHYIVVRDPFGGEDIIVEFCGYTQSIGSTAGTQRLSVWYDEEPSQDFRKEQIPRLLAEDGDEVITLTPANYISWMYDEIFEQASVYYKTDAICKFLESQGEKDFEQVKRVSDRKDIAVIQAATDDNPTLTKEAIEGLFENYSDPDDVAIRRYGLFKQVSGRIFKDFDYGVHLLDRKFEEKYFENGIPHHWIHARGIDYHPRTPWAFGCISVSPSDEVFIWASNEMSPEKRTTENITREISDVSSDYKFVLSLIDPLAEAHKRKLESGEIITVRNDINDTLRKLKMDGIGSGGYWRTWDTKGEKGRDEIKKRLMNSVKVGKPFNNKTKNGFLPTLWILPSAKVAAKSMRQWRWEQYGDSKMIQSNEEKNTPEQRWSHMNMVWEAIFKNAIFKMKKASQKVERKTNKRYFKRKKNGHRR